MVITVTRDSGPFKSEEWEFRYFNEANGLVLNFYWKRTRVSKRNKFRVTPDGYYSRLYGRDSTLPEQDVPLPDDVRAEALSKFVELVRVVKWSER